jgi:enoyl-CoA hydratase/carnithine racemase
MTNPMQAHKKPFKDYPARHFGWAASEDGRVATITLNRPDKKNPLTFESYAELRDLFRDLSFAADVRAIVLTGAGGNFCSGGDVFDIIEPLTKMAMPDLLAFTRMTGDVVKAMRRCPQPIIAAINGVAAGAGAVLALAADFRLMVPTATFRFLFTQVGLSGGDMGAAYLLPRTVGLARATEILMFGDPIDAQRACDIGLVNRVVEPGALRAETAALAQRIAGGPIAAYAATKLTLTAEQDMDLSTALAHEATSQAKLMAGDDHREFHAAFRQGRPPRWSGR